MTDEQLRQLENSLGLPSGALGTAGQYQGATGPSVYLGQKREPTTSGELTRERVPARLYGRTAYAIRDDAAPVDAMVNDVFSWSPAELRDFQEKAWEAGLYGNIDRDQVRFGDYDEDTQRAWGFVLGRAAGFYEAGKKLTPMQVLDQAAELARKEGLVPKGSASQRDPLTVRLTNPADSRLIAREVSTAVAGEAPPELVERIVSEYRRAEQEFQTRAYGMQETGGTITEPASAQAFAEDQVRRAMPVQAGAVDMLADLKAVNAWLGFDAA